MLGVGTNDRPLLKRSKSGLVSSYVLKLCTVKSMFVVADGFCIKNADASFSLSLLAEVICTFVFCLYYITLKVVA